MRIPSIRLLTRPLELKGAGIGYHDPYPRALTGIDDPAFHPLGFDDNPARGFPPPQALPHRRLCLRFVQSLPKLFDNFPCVVHHTHLDHRLMQIDTDKVLRLLHGLPPLESFSCCLLTMPQGADLFYTFRRCTWRRHAVPGWRREGGTAAGSPVRLPQPFFLHPTVVIVSVPSICWSSSVS